MVKIKMNPKKKTAKKNFAVEAYTQEKQIIPLPSKSNSLIKKGKK